MQNCDSYSCVHRISSYLIYDTQSIDSVDLILGSNSLIQKLEQMPSDEV